ncbi:Putative ribonuclease H protein At1g65750 [Linum perenne]
MEEEGRGSRQWGGGDGESGEGEVAGGSTGTVGAVVEGSWRSGEGRGRFGRLERCAGKLEEWGRMTALANEEELKRVKAKLEELHGVRELHVDGEWRRLWGIAVPPKVRHLVWRVAREVLPTRAAVIRRGMDIEPQCGLCNTGKETLVHFFLECQASRRCWDVAGVAGAIASVGANAASIIEWLFQMLGSVPTTTQQTICCVMWSLWAKRNRQVWQQESRTEEVVVKLVTDLLEEWKMAVGRRLEQVPSERRRPCDKWHKPCNGQVKVNVDGAVFNEEHKHGLGAVMRDERGAFQGMMQRLEEGVPPPREVEAIAILHAMRWVGEVRRQSVVYETDCLEVVQAVNGSGREENEFGRIVIECQRELSNQGDSKVVAVRRSGNSVSHVLACGAISSTQTFIGGCLLNGYCTI